MRRCDERWRQSRLRLLAPKRLTLLPCRWGTVSCCCCCFKRYKCHIARPLTPLLTCGLRRHAETMLRRCSQSRTVPPRWMHRFAPCSEPLTGTR